MEIAKKVVNGVSVMEVGGQAQAASVIRVLDAELRGAISLDGLRVLMDVSRLDFVDSACLEAFLSFQKKFTQVNAMLGFVNMNEYLKKVFEITRIADQFQCFDDMDSAMKAMKARRR